MIDKFTRAQLLAFALITALVVGYASVAYIGLPALLGFGRMSVSVNMPATGNLYPRALVTLNGVDVGEVSDVVLTDTGVRADLSVDSDAKIPTGSKVDIGSVSAIGEQYLNFTPPASGGQIISAGDVVPAKQVTMPTDVTDLLNHVNNLVSTLPVGDLNTSIRELSTAFTGTSGSLQRLLTSGSNLVGAATDNLGPTQQLITDAGPLLDAENRTGGDITSFSRDLRTFTQQLRDSDAQLRGTIEKTPQLTGQFDQLVNQIRPTLPELLDNLTAVGEVTKVYMPNIKHVLTLLPITTNEIESTIQRSPVPGTAILNFKAAINDPPACANGFAPQRRDPSDLSAAPAEPKAFCDEPADSPINVRGTRNSPCPNDPAVLSRNAHGCGLDFQSPADAAAFQAASVQYQLEVAKTLPTSVPRPADAEAQTAGVDGTSIPTPYDPGTGLFVGPDGHSYLLAGPTSTGKSKDWRSILLSPMGVPLP